MFVKTNFFLLVSTNAYLVIKTSRGFRSDTEIAVETIVLNIVQIRDAPPK